jgi:hypothetical protein
MAKKVKIKAKEKRQLEKLLVKVAAEYVFYCHDGSIFADFRELAEGLEAISDETFAYHVNSERNDFSKWVKDVIKDEKLASDLATATNRTQAAGYVTARLATLTSQGKMSKPIGDK